MSPSSSTIELSCINDMTSKLGIKSKDKSIILIQDYMYLVSGVSCPGEVMTV